MAEDEIIPTEETETHEPEGSVHLDAEESPEKAASGEAAAPAPEAPPVEEDKNWYIIHTYSGFEQKVADSLRGRAQAFGFADKIGQILIPTEEVVELGPARRSPASGCFIPATCWSKWK